MLVLFFLSHPYATHKHINLFEEKDTIDRLCLLAEQKGWVRAVFELKERHHRHDHINFTRTTDDDDASIDRSCLLAEEKGLEQLQQVIVMIIISSANFTRYH